MAQANRIFHFLNKEPGWAPISHMVAMACHCLEASLHDLSASAPSRLKRLRAVLAAPPKGGSGADIFIARNPFEIDRILAHPAFQERRAARVLWVIDSFWTDQLPKPAARVLSRFDLVGYTREGDGADYRALCGDRALFLGWGADVLDLGLDPGTRPWDVLRVGRQPGPWDDDSRTAAACAARGLRFHGRPPFGATPETQQRDLMQDWYARSKIIIAHSNLSAPAPYTHPSKDYITARWTDALACGATIAGQQPEGDIDLIDWPGALLPFPEIDLERNLDQIAEALQAWSPQQALHNRLQALCRLDWRWRFRDIAERIGHQGQPLQRELDRLQTEVSHASEQLGQTGS